MRDCMKRGKEQSYTDTDISDFLIFQILQFSRAEAFTKNVNKSNTTNCISCRMIRH